STVTPLLVRLYHSHKLHGLASDDKPLARAELTSAVSELLEMELSPKESELIADVLIGLMRQAEIDLREALSERLAVLENVPLRLILQLANDEIPVAAPVLSKSPVLGDMDLIYIIKSKGPEYWQAIARRENMSNQIMNLLTDTRDIDTAIQLVKNKNINLTEYSLTILSDLAQQSDALAAPLLRREEVGPELAKVLYAYVGEEIKEQVKTLYGFESQSVVQTIDEVIVEMVEASDAVSEFAPSEAILRAADRYKQKGLLTIKLMLGTLRRGQIAAFVAQFSRYSGLPPKTTLEILSQTSGQGLAVACKAFDVPKEDFISIFLLTNRVRNHGHMVALNDMTKAISYFNKIKPEVARNIIENSLDEELKK
ncbi:MAG: DUF2336 domain-containing protein, partial [Alphaproteobacteria bacterium]|nr:DUF2336 domain-containing protein [Alphaproteobacteria bacterium]